MTQSTSNRGRQKEMRDVAEKREGTGQREERQKSQIDRTDRDILKDGVSGNIF